MMGYLHLLWAISEHKSALSVDSGCSGDIFYNSRSSPLSCNKTFVYYMLFVAIYELVPCSNNTIQSKFLLYSPFILIRLMFWEGEQNSDIPPAKIIEIPENTVDGTCKDFM